MFAMMMWFHLTFHPMHQGPMVRPLTAHVVVVK